MPGGELDQELSLLPKDICLRMILAGRPAWPKGRQSNVTAKDNAGEGDLAAQWRHEWPDGY
jgi:hypothetical protein